MLAKIFTLGNLKYLSAGIILVSLTILYRDNQNLVERNSILMRENRAFLEHAESMNEQIIGINKIYRQSLDMLLENTKKKEKVSQQIKQTKQKIVKEKDEAMSSGLNSAVSHVLNGLLAKGADQNKSGKN
ncbi:hypothetical protein ACHJH3_08700 [Campylobacter sp. MOP7]|uniref:hypothetical protein n=1 Tax=Campylobacter canis TaxID=3378588 RepID=UPI00387E8B1C